jgi:hypothetical protein
MQILEINSEKPIKDVQIKDLSGKIVYQSSSSDNKLSVDISGLTSAVYVVIVITNNAHYQKKIFKY